MLLEVLLSLVLLTAGLFGVWAARYFEKDIYLRRKVARNDYITGIGVLACIDLLITTLFVFFTHEAISSVLLISRFNGVVTMPIVEEFIYRVGVIGLSKFWLGNYKIGFVVSAILFGFMHIFNSGVTLIHIPYFIIMGLIYGYGYIRYGLICCIFIHSLGNLLVYTLFTLI